MKRAIMALAIIAVFAFSLFAYYYSVPTIKWGQITGILTLYKNGARVYEGPDVLTNDFGNFLVWAAGNIKSGGSTSAAFATGPPTPSCYVSISGTTISTPSGKAVYVAGTGAPIITFGTNTVATPGDCVLTNIVGTATATVSVYSGWGGNYQNPPAPCPSPAVDGCVQVSATYSASSAVSISDVALYSVVCPASSCASNYYTILAHDVFSAVGLNAGDTLTAVYTFIMPPVPTSSGAYNPGQGAYANMFAQALGRTYFGIGGSSSRLFIDNVLVSSAVLSAFAPASSCSDIAPSSTSTGISPQTVYFSVSASAKKVNIYGLAQTALSGVQVIQYAITVGGTGPQVLSASLPCTAATATPLAQGQAFGLQLSWP